MTDEDARPATPEQLRATLLLQLARAWRAYREGNVVSAVLLLRRARRTITDLIRTLEGRKAEEEAP